MSGIRINNPVVMAYGAPQAGFKAICLLLWLRHAEYAYYFSSIEHSSRLHRDKRNGAPTARCRDSEMPSTEELW